MNDDSTKIAGAFILGGLVGAFIALIYAPKAGRETRKDISRTAKRIKKQAGDLVEETIETVNNIIDEVKDRATDIIDRGTELSDGAKKEIVTTFEQGQKLIEKQKNRIAKALGI